MEGAAEDALNPPRPRRPRNGPFPRPARDGQRQNPVPPGGASLLRLGAGRPKASPNTYLWDAQPLLRWVGLCSTPPMVNPSGFSVHKRCGFLLGGRRVSGPIVPGVPRRIRGPASFRPARPGPRGEVAWLASAVQGGPP